MTLAKPTTTNTSPFDLSSSDVVDPQPMALDTGLKARLGTDGLEAKLGDLVAQTTHGAISRWSDLWCEYRPVTTDKTQAVWQLLQSTQPVQLLLTAALAVLAIALVTLVATFSGMIILGLKMAALVLAAVAVGQWITRGLSWADQKLPSGTGPNE